MRKFLIILLTLMITSCSSNKKKSVDREININDCAYFRQQKIFVIQEENDQFLLFAEMKGMKFVYTESKNKFRKYAIKVKCEQNIEYKIQRFLNNHY